MCRSAGGQGGAHTALDNGARRLPVGVVPDVDKPGFGKPFIIVHKGEVIRLGLLCNLDTVVTGEGDTQARFMVVIHLMILGIIAFDQLTAGRLGIVFNHLQAQRQVVRDAQAGEAVNQLAQHLGALASANANSDIRERALGWHNVLV